MSNVFLDLVRKRAERLGFSVVCSARSEPPFVGPSPVTLSLGDGRKWTTDSLTSAENYLHGYELALRRVNAGELDPHAIKRVLT